MLAIPYADDLQAGLLDLGPLGAEAGDELVIVSGRARRLDDAVATALASSRGNVLVARRPFARGPIVAACDFSDCALAAVRTARALAQRCHTELVALHAVEERGRSESAPVWVERIQAARYALADAAGPEARLLVEAGGPAEILVRIERELGARLLVVGMGRAAEAVGRVTQRVVAVSTGPVLLVRK